MPIKPENRALYPYEWKKIRAEVLERAGDKCDLCGAENHALGHHSAYGDWHQCDQCSLFSICDFERIKIALTIAHIDHDPTNNGEPGNRQNLEAL